MIQVYEWNKGNVVASDSSFPTGLPTDDTTWMWVDVVGEPREVISEIADLYGLDPGAVDEALAMTHLPLVEEHLNEVFVVLHGLAAEPDGRLSTPEINLFIGPQFLITIRDGARTTIEEVQRRLEVEGGLPVESPAGLLAHLAFLSGRRLTPIIQELETRADGLEEMAIRGDPQTALEAHALRRDVIYLRRALSPQFDVYDDLSKSPHPAFGDEANQLFARVASQHRRALEALEAGRALLQSVIDTYRGAVADQTNEIMRVLTVFSAIMLPLTLIAGIWGMNFLDVPGATAEWGFWGLLGAMVVMAVGVWIYFARRGFIGAPRLRDLPKSVGLGLFTLGTAPIRVVTESIRYLGKTED